MCKLILDLLTQWYLYCTWVLTLLLIVFVLVLDDSLTNTAIVGGEASVETLL